MKTSSKYIQKLSLLAGLLLLANLILAANLPAGFVYLKQIDPTIQQDLRYAGNHNFIGRPVKGYLSGNCILTKPTALALQRVQKALQPWHLGLKVFDCYRPQQAVDNFVQWSQNLDDQTMRAEFYPHVPKNRVFDLGYIADRSGHSRGSTVDLTIVPLHGMKAAPYHLGQKLFACYSPQRYFDGGIEMGTGFDCFDPKAHFAAKNINPVAQNNRVMLRDLMEKNGFDPYQNEWWHFTLHAEPFRKTYFNFPVE